MAITQADLDAITGNLRSLRSELTDDNSRIQSALADLAAANPNLDLTEVNAALSDLTQTVDSTSAIVPATPGDGGTVQPPTDPGAGTGDGTGAPVTDPGAGDGGVVDPTV
jgi:hypothetical protein